MLLQSQVRTYCSIKYVASSNSYTRRTDVFVMEPRSAAEIIQQYQPLLREHECDENLVLLDAQEEPGTKVGENYMSVMLRTRVSGKRGDGSPYHKSFMRKILENSELARICRSDRLFDTEVHFYKNVLTQLGPFGPTCLVAHPNELILEDLTCRDFSIRDRCQLLDLEHALAVIQTLASFHASSLNLKLRSPSSFAELVGSLRENVFPKDEETSFGLFYEQGIRYALECLFSIEERTPEVQRAIEFLNDYKGQAVSKMTRLLYPEEADANKYWVITHGDLWKNNLMFLHNPQGRVARVKLVDFQVARHSTPTIDFMYFLYSSVKTEVLENADELIDTYERFFVHDLRRLDAPELDLKILAQPGWFKEELKRSGVLGFFGALMVMHAILADEDEVQEMKTAMNEFKADEIDKFMGENMPVQPKKTEKIFSIVDHFVKNFSVFS